ncbi:S41 family peptidase [Thermosipho atlanticus]|uniref:C-terminal processing protease CtpA/Prc, contains a PDZ domain n=1 Tax=Thermosipho atlanticus DSM 15807 TaxID=1123380 RepID=A0A1M5R6C8_9BACT|nr:S41 family peptidase [Thermosipho atlanticus]SHH21590.1 C-terminal processing protease CtpA/Prc, contains a PDZ domain [Thermosipho atlanticus DSM 15807]
MEKFILYFLLITIPVILILSATIYHFSLQKSPYDFKEQLSVNTIMTKEEMEIDLNYLVNTLRDVHPKTVNGFNKEQIHIIKKAYEKIQNPMSVGEFYFILNEVISSLKDAHSMIWINTTKEDRIINLPMIWLEDGMYIKEDVNNLKKGDKIISIGGKTENELLIKLQKIIPAENQQWVKVMGKINLVKEPFLNYLRLINNGYVDIVVQRNGQKIKTKLPLTKQPTYPNNNNYKMWVSYKIYPEKSLGIFRLDKCIYNEVYKSTLENFFKEVSKYNIKNIAIDVRKNTGGDSRVIDEFMKYIDIDKYLFYTGDIRFSRQASKQRGYIRKKGYKSYPKRVIINKKIQDHDLIYNGKIYVLTSFYTFSSGNWFAVVIKDNKLGTIIGEPTGNQPSSYGDILRFQLPISGFKFYVSHKKWVRPNISNDPEDCLHPDIEVYTTIEDILNKKDPQIERLIKIIDKKP